MIVKQYVKHSLSNQNAKMYLVEISGKLLYIQVCFL